MDADTVDRSDVAVVKADVSSLMRGARRVVVVVSRPAAPVRHRSQTLLGRI